MDAKTQIENALREAMRSGDDVRKRSIRSVLAAIKMAMVEKEKSTTIEDASVHQILQKEIKSRRESILDAQKANRPDLISASEAEILVLEEFLPKQLITAELEELVRAAIVESGAKSPTEMGKVMKALMPKVQGRAAGDQVNLTVRRLLTN